MTDLPEPLTPPECDLRGMPFMPVDLVRLFDSDIYALSSGDEFKAAFTLWGKAFLQVPAGSLPTDDRILAHLSGAGSNWRKVRDMALRGWIKASDGRLYHPVVAEKAREAWQARLAQRARTEAARQARAQKRQSSDSGPAGANTPPVTERATKDVTSPVTFSVTENVTGSKGQGQGQGQGIVDIPPTPQPLARPGEARAQGTRLAPDWTPSPEDAGFAHQLGLDPDATAAEFRDYWRAVPGAKGRKLDWSATFRNSCRMLASRRPAARKAEAARPWWLEDMLHERH